MKKCSSFLFLPKIRWYSWLNFKTLYGIWISEWCVWYSIRSYDKKISLISISQVCKLYTFHNLQVYNPIIDKGGILCTSSHVFVPLSLCVLQRYQRRVNIQPCWEFTAMINPILLQPFETLGIKYQTVWIRIEVFYILSCLRLIKKLVYLVWVSHNLKFRFQPMKNPKKFRIIDIDTDLSIISNEKYSLLETKQISMI